MTDTQMTFVSAHITLFTFSSGTSLGSWTHFLVYTYNFDGEAATPEKLQIVDRTKPSVLVSGFHLWCRMCSQMGLALRGAGRRAPQATASGRCR